jgi:branched-chain amino acid transport system substrate-binding protein
MNTKKMAGAAVLVSGALVLSACGQGGPGGESGDFTDDKIVLGVLNDQSGVYKDLSGPNSVKAVEMAIADFEEK